MVSILLIILKIIGIVLLVIIGLVLLLLFLVLFVPIRYKIEGDYEEAFRCKIVATWLLHFLSVRVNIEEEVVTTARVLGIPVSVFQKKEGNPKKGTSSKKKRGKATKKVSEDAGVMVVSEEERKSPQPDTESNSTQTAPDDFDQAQQEDEKKTSFFDKWKDKLSAIIEKIKAIPDKVRSFFDKIKSFVHNTDEKIEKVKFYIRLSKTEMFKEAFTVCKKKIIILLKHILPRKMRVNIHYGMDDPANTGYILGVYGVLPEFIGERFLLYPDFENTLFKCDFRMKGSIRIWTLLFHILVVVLDENCKKVYHIVKKERANESE